MTEWHHGGFASPPDPKAAESEEVEAGPVQPVVPSAPPDTCAEHLLGVKDSKSKHGLGPVALCKLHVLPLRVLVAAIKATRFLSHVLRGHKAAPCPRLTAPRADHTAQTGDGQRRQ